MVDFQWVLVILRSKNFNSNLNWGYITREKGEVGERGKSAYQENIWSDYLKTGKNSKNRILLNPKKTILKNPKFVLFLEID